MILEQAADQNARIETKLIENSFDYILPLFGHQSYVQKQSLNILLELDFI